MKIGELSRRTGVATRLLRYYEQQGLISAGRSENGYRCYGEEDVAHVERAAALVRSGLPTRLARAILDLETLDQAELAANCSRSVAEDLATELVEIEGRIACLTKTRDTIKRFLALTEHAALLEPAR